MRNSYHVLSLLCGSLGLAALLLALLVAPGPVWADTGDPGDGGGGAVAAPVAVAPGTTCQNNCVSAGNPPNCTCPAGAMNNQTCNKTAGPPAGRCSPCTPITVDVPGYPLFCACGCGSVN